MTFKTRGVYKKKCVLQGFEDGMIPFYDVNTIEEVKNFYPYWYGEYLYEKPKVKEFIKKELEDLSKRQNGGKINAQLKSRAKAKGVYRFLWCMEHNLDQMTKLSWKICDLPLLINRMRQAGYDPYSTTEDTTGAFIESLPGKGYPEKIINGKTVRLYDPYK